MDRSATTAAELLNRIFQPLGVPLAFRLWDGRRVRVGARGESPCEIRVHAPQTLRRLLRHPTPLRFGEAFVSGEIDIEGDLFAAMAIANQVEHLRVPLATRLAALLGTFRL